MPRPESADSHDLFQAFLHGVTRPIEFACRDAYAHLPTVRNLDRFVSEQVIGTLGERVYPIALGSSVQIALFVAPLLVLLSLIAAPVPFVLSFSRGEITLVFMSLLITTFVASGGKTNWYKGVQLLTIYLIFAILFFLIPGQ